MGSPSCRAEQGFAADRFQRTLLRRSRFQRRLKPGVRLHEVAYPQRMQTDGQGARSLTEEIPSPYVIQPGRQA